MFRQFKLALSQSIFLALIPLCLIFLSGCQLVSALGFTPKPLPFDKNPACHFQRPAFSKDTPLQLLTPEAFKENTLACLSNESSPLEELMYIYHFMASFERYYQNLSQSPSSLWKPMLSTVEEPHESDYEMDLTSLGSALSEIQSLVKTPKFLKWVMLKSQLNNLQKRNYSFIDEKRYIIRKFKKQPI